MLSLPARTARGRSLRVCGFALAALVGCADSLTTTDAGAVDAAVPDAVAADVRSTLDVTDAPPTDAPPTDAPPTDAPPTDAPPTDTPPPGAPLVASPRTWTWIDLDGAVCDDGSPTGVGVNLVPGAPGVVVFLSGGGACFDYVTCAQINTSAHGPFGAAQFNAIGDRFDGTILDRELAGSPFAGWNMVFVPYCTGDLHAGDRVVTYTGAGAPRTIHHKGRANLGALLPRLAATMSPGDAVALVGSSSGGFGALLNHAHVRAALPAARLYVIDDSGPLLPGDSVPAALRARWYESWGLAWLDEACPACRSDLSRLAQTLAARFPQDRTALISSLRDRVNRTTFGLSDAAYEQGLREALATFNALPGRRAFVVEGETHGTLLTVASFRAGGTGLTEWLAQMVRDSADWTARAP